MFYDLGGTPVLVYQTDFAGTAKNTAFGLISDDLDRDMPHLRTHGVMFHDYDMPGLKTVDGVADSATCAPPGSATARATSSRSASCLLR